MTSTAIAHIANCGVGGDNPVVRTERVLTVEAYLKLAGEGLEVVFLLPPLSLTFVRSLHDTRPLKLEFVSIGSSVRLSLF
jgi:hypothetical protein